MRFDEITLSEKLQEGIKAAGFEECMPVQERAIPAVIEGRDVTVKSQTGSGKTAAFLIPVLEIMLREPGKKALIIVPTRELATQIEEDAKILASNTDLKIATIFGGVGYKKQQDKLSAGVDIVIATPGRLIDLYKGKHYRFKDADFLVIDEADRLFDMGFYPDLKYMLSKMKSREERHTMLFSATLSTRVQNIAWEHMREPVEIEIQSEVVPVEVIQQTLFHVGRSEKIQLLLGLLKRDKPQNGIIFTNTKRQAEELAHRLTHNGYEAQFLMGDLPQKKRTAIINRAKSGKVPFLVATDVAARGLHVDDLQMVVNYDVPEDAENYVHRIGRTARAGKSGKAYTLACERFVYGLESIEKYIGMKIPVGDVSDDLLVADSSADIRIIRDPEMRRQKKRSDRKGDGGNSRSEGRNRRSEGQNRRNNQKDGQNRKYDKNDNYKKDKGRNRKFDDAKQTNRSDRRPRREQSRDSRLDYYKQKYGETFESKKKPSLWDKIKGIFGIGQSSKKSENKDRNKHGKNQNPRKKSWDSNKPGKQKKKWDKKPDQNRSGQKSHKKSNHEDTNKSDHQSKKQGDRPRRRRRRRNPEAPKTN